MLSLLTLQQDYVRAYRRYADTVAVLSAIYHVLKETPLLVDWIGIEQSVKNCEGNLVTPDLMALYERRAKGLMFELKWSLPFSEELLEKEVKELKKYGVRCSQWKSSTGEVNYHDVVLVCNVEDSQRTVNTISRVATEVGYDFLTREGFIVWTWVISAVRGGERSEHLVLTEVHGKIRYDAIENRIKPSGLILPEGSLTYLRSTFNFIRSKPPVQYTIIKLIQHVFSQFQDTRRGAFLYELTTDAIYEKAKILFPSWHDLDTPTIQAKRAWIAEALETMCALEIIAKSKDRVDNWLVPIPTFRTRKPIETALCSKLAKYQLKIKKRPARRGRKRTRPIKPATGLRMKSLDDFPH